jgi:hypothetical protein
MAGRQGMTAEQAEAVFGEKHMVSMDIPRRM